MGNLGGETLGPFLFWAKPMIAKELRIKIPSKDMSDLIFINKMILYLERKERDRKIYSNILRKCQFVVFR